MNTLKIVIEIEFLESLISNQRKLILNTCLNDNFSESEKDVICAKANEFISECKNEIISFAKNLPFDHVLSKKYFPVVENPNNELYMM